MAATHTRSFTQDNFATEVLKADLPVLVDFTAVWCQPCKVIGKAIDALAQTYEGKALIGKVDIDEEGALARRYKVDAVPTLILFVNGRSKGRLVGAQPKKTIETFLKKALD